MSFIVFYAICCPFAALFSYFTNLIDFDIKLRSLANYDRRARSKVASGIGNWLGVMEFMSLVSIPINTALIFFARAPPKDDSEFE